MINPKYNNFFEEFNDLENDKFKYVIFSSDQIENIWIGNVEIILDGFETFGE